MKIACVVGSIHSKSRNLQLARAVETLLPEHVTFVYPDLDLPLFSQDRELDYPHDVQKMKDMIADSDGVLIVTPEYNRSIPAPLKNAIDWASRPWESHPFRGKPTGIIGVSTGVTGTAQSQQQLRSVLVYLEARVMGQPELYLQASRTLRDDGGVHEEIIPRLQTYVNAFVAHIDFYSR